MHSQVRGVRDGTQAVPGVCPYAQEVQVEAPVQLRDGDGGEAQHAHHRGGHVCGQDHGVHVLAQVHDVQAHVLGYGVRLRDLGGPGDHHRVKNYVNSEDRSTTASSSSYALKTSCYPEQPYGGEHYLE